MMDLRDKVPVEPLDQVRVDRIERRILASARPIRIQPDRRRIWPVAVAGTVALAVFATIYVDFRMVREQTGEAVPPEPTVLSVSTGSGEETVLRLGDAQLRVAENTDMTITRRQTGSVLVDLESGKVDCDVTPRPQRAPFQVRSDDVAVTVIGTSFSVERDRLVRVTVARGLVAVTTGPESHHLRAGDEWSGSPHYGQIVAEVDLADPVDTADPRAVDEPIAPPRLPTRHRRKPENSESTDISDLLADDAETFGAPLAAASVPRRPRAAKVVSDRVSGLLRIESQNPEKAAAEYLSVATSSSGAEASFALYSRAYLQLEKLNRPADAARTANQYERRFPNGSEAQQMLWIRIRGLCESEQLESCRAAAHSYLRRYPSGDFHDLARQIINW